MVNKNLKKQFTVYDNDTSMTWKQENKVKVIKFNMNL